MEAMFSCLGNKLLTTSGLAPEIIPLRTPQIGQINYCKIPKDAICTVKISKK